MLRVFILFCLVLINFTFQTTLFPHIAILGVTPDTMLVFIICYGILRGDIEGAVFGFFAGLAHDVLGGLVIGVYALLGFLSGYVSGKPFKDFFKHNYFLPFLIVVFISFIYQFVLYFTTIMVAGQLEFWHYAGTIILPKTIYTAIFAIPIYSLMHFINAKLEKYEERFEPFFARKKDK